MGERRRPIDGQSRIFRKNRLSGISDRLVRSSGIRHFAADNPKGSEKIGCAFRREGCGQINVRGRLLGRGTMAGAKLEKLTG